MGEEEIRSHWRDIGPPSAAGNQEAEHEIYAQDAICDYPQSGKRIVGRHNLQALRSHHPDKRSGFRVIRILDPVISGSLSTPSLTKVGHSTPSASWNLAMGRWILLLLGTENRWCLTQARRHRVCRTASARTHVLSARRLVIEPRGFRGGAPRPPMEYPGDVTRKMMQSLDCATFRPAVLRVSESS
jgi:hypothetical protein